MTPPEKEKAALVDGIMAERKALYEGRIAAWRESSKFVRTYATELEKSGPMAFPLIMIANKLHRALVSPDFEDHYVDIIGYATLALEALGLPAPFSKDAPQAADRDEDPSEWLKTDAARSMPSMQDLKQLPPDKTTELLELMVGTLASFLSAERVGPVTVSRLADDFSFELSRLLDKYNLKGRK